jgi:hypothetical protein
MNTRSISTLAIFLSGIIHLHADSSQASPDFSGQWEATASVSDFETRDSTLTVVKKDKLWHSTMESEDGQKRKMSRTQVKGKTLIVEFEMESNGQKAVIGAKAELNKEGALIGKWYARDENGTQLMSNDWKAVRSLSSAFAGNWNVLAETDDNNIEHKMVINKKDNQFSGYATGDEGQIEYRRLKITKNEVKMELPYAGGIVKVVAKLTQPGKLSGKWHYFDEFDQQVADGKWSANKSKISLEK